MTYLDTNIFLRYAIVSDALFTVAQNAIYALLNKAEILAFSPQVIYEFWATVTRPVNANGLGFTIDEATAEVARMHQGFYFLPDQTLLYSEWEAIVKTHKCHGKVSYDARHVAAMRTHGITRILTFNVGDFQRFSGLTVLDPRTITIP